MTIETEIYIDPLMRRIMDVMMRRARNSIILTSHDQSLLDSVFQGVHEWAATPGQKIHCNPKPVIWTCQQITEFIVESPNSVYVRLPKNDPIQRLVDDFQPFSPLILIENLEKLAPYDLSDFTSLRVGVARGYVNYFATVLNSRPEQKSFSLGNQAFDRRSTYIHADKF